MSSLNSKEKKTQSKTPKVQKILQTCLDQSVLSEMGGKRKKNKKEEKKCKEEMH